MKTKCLAAFAVLFSVLNVGWFVTVKCAPRVEYSAPVNLGEIWVGESVTSDVELRNTGLLPLRIESAVAGCSCLTILETSRKGKVTAVSIKLDSSNLERGKKIVEIVLATNDPSNRLVRIPVNVKVRSRLYIEPKRITVIPGLLDSINLDEEFEFRGALTVKSDKKISNLKFITGEGVEGVGIDSTSDHEAKVNFIALLEPGRESISHELLVSAIVDGKPETVSVDFSMTRRD